MKNLLTATALSFSLSVFFLMPSMAGDDPNDQTNQTTSSPTVKKEAPKKDEQKEEQNKTTKTAPSAPITEKELEKELAETNKKKAALEKELATKRLVTEMVTNLKKWKMPLYKDSDSKDDPESKLFIEVLEAALKENPVKQLFFCNSMEDASISFTSQNVKGILRVLNSRPELEEVRFNLYVNWQENIYSSNSSTGPSFGELVKDFSKNKGNALKTLTFFEQVTEPLVYALLTEVEGDLPFTIVFSMNSSELHQKTKQQEVELRAKTLQKLFKGKVKFKVQPILGFKGEVVWSLSKDLGNVW